MENPNVEIDLQVSRLIDYLSASLDADSVPDVGQLHQSILNAVNKFMEPLYPDQSFDCITAHQAVLQVEDASTGRLFTRLLPLSYTENSNGLTLDGEDAAGAPSRIVFLSETAVKKIDDVTGQGRDNPRCKD